MQVWAEALDSWLQQLAKELVQEQNALTLTADNVEATLSVCWPMVTPCATMQHGQHRLLSTQK